MEWCAVFCLSFITVARPFVIPEHKPRTRFPSSRDLYIAILLLKQVRISHLSERASGNTAVTSVPNRPWDRSHSILQYCAAGLRQNQLGGASVCVSAGCVRCLGSYKMRFNIANLQHRSGMLYPTKPWSHQEVTRSSVCAVHARRPQTLYLVTSSNPARRKKGWLPQVM